MNIVNIMKIMNIMKVMNIINFINYINFINWLAIQAFTSLRKNLYVWKKCLRIMDDFQIIFF